MWSLSTQQSPLLTMGSILLYLECAMGVVPRTCLFLFVKTFWKMWCLIQVEDLSAREVYEKLLEAVQPWGHILTMSRTCTYMGLCMWRIYYSVFIHGFSWWLNLGIHISMHASCILGYLEHLLLEWWQTVPYFVFQASKLGDAFSQYKLVAYFFFLI